MEQALREAIARAVDREPFAKAFNMRLVALEEGYSRVVMDAEPSRMNNIYQRTHGGAIFGLIDEAFETASQTGGDIAVALNVNVTYMASPENGSQLTAEARQISQSKKISNFDITVTEDSGRLIASCRAMAYRTGKPVSL
ncbi:MAG TPA: hotdog fold thioesterase [Desulfosalsimonadaceae bacterium]|nr:hotdog fold thioesterase [Desulfosalsimonadaceae bacterium]